MSFDNPKTVSIIENTIIKAVKDYTAAESMNLTSDLYIQADHETGELQVFDETETLLNKIVVFDWVNTPDEKIFYEKIIPLLKNSLSSLATKDTFEHSSFVKPFSVSLTDDEFTIIEELLFLDDETFRLDDPLLKDLDTELDEFLSNLLSDLE